jgi:hypothetical protein
VYHSRALLVNLTALLHAGRVNEVHGVVLRVGVSVERLRVGEVIASVVRVRYALKKEAVTELVDRYGITSPKGPAGSVLFFHGNIVHGSPNNISPFGRLLTFITFNSVENVPGRVHNPRPEFLVSRDAAPVTPLPDSALLM